MDWEDKIAKSGLCSEEELVTIRNHFGKTSSALKYCVRKYGLQDKRVLDLGCGYGDYLLNFGRDSVGVDGDEKNCKIVRLLGYEAFKANLEEEWPDMGKFDAVWCSNIVEHMIAPWQFLVRIRKLLKPDGLLLVTCPVMTNAFFEKLGMFKGFDASDHVNFFTRRTLATTVRRSGYVVLETNSGIPVNPFLNFLFSPLKLISPQITVVARVNPDFAISKKNLLAMLPSWSRKYLSS